MSCLCIQEDNAIEKYYQNMTFNKEIKNRALLGIKQRKGVKANEIGFVGINTQIFLHEHFASAVNHLFSKTRVICLKN